MTRFSDRADAGRRLASLRTQGARRIVLAAGVGAADSAVLLRGQVDDLVCVLEPSEMGAVGLYFDQFDPVSDDEVVALLDGARHPAEVSS